MSMKAVSEKSGGYRGTSNLGSSALWVRGQAAIEFLAYAGFFLTLFAFSTLYFVSQQDGEMRQKENMLAKEVGSQFADDVNFAVAAGSGFRGTFTIPRTLSPGTAYNARFGSDGFVYLNWTNLRGEFVYLYPMSTKNITKAPGAPAYVSLAQLPLITYIDIDESKGNLTIINTDGMIYLNQS